MTPLELLEKMRERVASNGVFDANTAFWHNDNDNLRDTIAMFRGLRETSAGVDEGFIQIDNDFFPTESQLKEFEKGFEEC